MFCLRWCIGTFGKSPKPLGSIRIRENEKVGLDEKQGGIYGGVGDKPHLGGWTTYDEQGVSNHTWNYMMGIIGVKSVLDIGCGRGISSSYFYENGARVKCIEGSIDAIDHTFLPKQENQELIINHDFTRGPYWPDETFDACWSIEVLEHLSRQYVKNYMSSFRRCALIFVSASVWGGHHHVEVHAQWWWKARFAAYGMQYLRDVTRDIHQVTMWEKHYLKRLWDAKSVHDHRVGTYGQHITHGLMVFINPEVASLPEHDHLFSGDGCYDAKWGVGNTFGGEPCISKEDILPERYIPLLRCTRTEEDAEVLGIKHDQLWWQCEKQPKQNYKRIPMS
jgi:SAM-dependent methyltransferase